MSESDRRSSVDQSAEDIISDAIQQINQFGSEFNLSLEEREALARIFIEQLREKIRSVCQASGRSQSPQTHSIETLNQLLSTLTDDQRAKVQPFLGDSIRAFIESANRVINKDSTTDSSS